MWVQLDICDFARNEGEEIKQPFKKLSKPLEDKSADEYVYCS